MPSSLGPAEILVILVVALIVLGPKRLPEAGRQVGKALSEIRRWSQDVKYEMDQAFNPEVVRDPTPLADPAPQPPDPVVEPPAPTEPSATAASETVPPAPAPPEATPDASPQAAAPPSEAPADEPRP